MYPWPELRHWSHFQLEELYPQAEHAQERLAAHLDKSDRLASRFEAKRMRAASSRVASESALPTMSRLMRGPDSASAANHRPVTRAASPSRAGEPLASQHLVDHPDQRPPRGPGRTP